MKNLVTLDIVLLVLGILLVLRGFMRGLIKEFFALGAPVLGVLGSFLLYKNGAYFLRFHFFQDMRFLPEVLAFIIVFIIISLVCKFVQKLLSDVIKGLRLDPIDKLLGLVFGFLEGIAAISLVLFIIIIQPLFDPSRMIEGSFFSNLLMPFIIDTSVRIPAIPLIPETLTAAQITAALDIV